MNQIKDTRGRHRNPYHEDLAGQIARYHDMEALPQLFYLPGYDVKKELKRFRNSQSFKDLQQEYGTIFRMLPKNEQVLVCYRSSYNGK